MRRDLIGLLGFILFGVSFALTLMWLTGCAFGNEDWRKNSYNTTVELQKAGDERCSSPAPWVSFRACLIHDAAYETNRRFRCRGDYNQENTSEQARLVADLILAQQMALDGYGELWTTAYYESVRLGGWIPWYFGGCTNE